MRSSLSRDDIASRPEDLWRYHELLPVRDVANVTTLGEGMTPLLPLPTYGGSIVSLPSAGGEIVGILPAHHH